MTNSLLPTSRPPYSLKGRYEMRATLISQAQHGMIGKSVQEREKAIFDAALLHIREVAAEVKAQYGGHLLVDGQARITPLALPASDGWPPEPAPAPLVNEGAASNFSDGDSLSIPIAMPTDTLPEDDGSPI